MDEPRDSVELAVATAAWFYPSQALVRLEKARAEAQFADAGVSVFAGLHGSEDRGFVALVGPVANVERAEGEWSPVGGERGELREDIAFALSARHVAQLHVVVVTDGEGGYEPRPDLGGLMDVMDEIERKGGGPGE